MKISRDAMSYGQKIEFSSIEDATVDTLIPDPYSYEGQLEKLQAENKKLRDIVSRLAEVLLNNNHVTLDNRDIAIKYILGYGYEIEE